MMLVPRPSELSNSVVASAKVRGHDVHALASSTYVRDSEQPRRICSRVCNECGSTAPCLVVKDDRKALRRLHVTGGASGKSYIRGRKSGVTKKMMEHLSLLIDNNVFNLSPVFFARYSLEA